jgi:hypothetical protein
MRRTWTSRILWTIATVVLGTEFASAQVIGSFGWQTQPYCNVVTVTVVQQGEIFQLSGSDNLCGAGTAAVTGTAVPTAQGVQFGLTVAMPRGRPSHVSATISLATLSGSWVDAEGHSGPFVFGANVAGSARPTPSGAPRRQVVSYAGTTSSPGGSIAPPVKQRDLGTFATTGGPVALTWTSHISMNTGGLGCNFQIRVDGQPEIPLINLAELVGNEALITNGVTNAAVPATVSAWFPALSAGTHTVELWIRSVAATCTDNIGNFPRQVVVEEFGTP